LIGVVGAVAAAGFPDVAGADGTKTWSGKLVESVFRRRIVARVVPEIVLAVCGSNG
jgi:hypothetical protein